MIFIFISLICYTIAIFLGTLASRSTDTNFVSAIMSFISAIIPIGVVIPILNKKLFTGDSNKFGILMAVLAGIFIAIFTLALNKSYSENKVAIVVPLVFGGSILLSSVLSFIFFKEKTTLIESIGLGMLTIGLLIITYARFTGK